MGKIILIGVFFFCAPSAFSQMPSWSHIQLPVDSLMPVGLNFFDSLHGYFYGSHGYKNTNLLFPYYEKMFWFKTNDGGLSWQAVTDSVITSDTGSYSNLTHFTGLLYPDIKNQYIFLENIHGGDSVGIAHTTNSGNSWQIVNSWNTPHSPVFLASIYSGNILAFNIDDRSIYGSIDGGRSFPERYMDSVFRKAVYPGYPKDSTHGAFWPSFGYSDINTWTVSLTFSRSYHDIINPTGLQTLVSMNSGKSWEYYNTPIPGETDSLRISGLLQYIKGTPNVYYFPHGLREGFGGEPEKIIDCGSCSGLGINFLSSTDYGRSWTVQKAFANERRGYEAVQKNEVWITATDYKLPLDDATPAYKICRTLDNGTTWGVDSMTLSIESEKLNGRIVTFSDPHHGWIAAMGWPHCYIYRYDEKDQVHNNVESSTTERDFKIYPNPANTEVSIELPTSEAHLIIEIYDILGIKQHIRYHTNGRIAAINTQELPSGSYIARIINSEGTLKKIFLVQH